MKNAELLDKLTSVESIIDFIDGLAEEFNGVDEDVVDLLHKACDDLDLVLTRKEELASEEAKSNLPADFLAKLRAMGANCNTMATTAEQMRDTATDIDYAEEIAEVFDDLYNAANAARAVINEYLSLNEHPQEQEPSNPAPTKMLSLMDILRLLH